MNQKKELERTQPIIDGLNASIRENPLAAGFIGAGLMWMLMGGTRGIGTVANVAKSAAIGAGSVVASAGRKVTDTISTAASQTVSGLKADASGVDDSVNSIVPDLSIQNNVIAVKDGVVQKVTSAGEAARNFSGTLHSQLSRSFESQPLLLGMVGLAIGAGMGSAIATTAFEKKWVGEQATAARGKLGEFADEAKGRAQDVIADIKDEVVNQGLTPDAAKNVVSDLVEKLKTVATDTQGALGESGRATSGM